MLRSTAPVVRRIIRLIVSALAVFGIIILLAIIALDWTYRVPPAVFKIDRAIEMTGPGAEPPQNESRILDCSSMASGGDGLSLDHRARLALCLIKREGAKEAREDRSTIMGSNFHKQLSSYFFGDFLNEPKPTVALRALEKVSAHEPWAHRLISAYFLFRGPLVVPDGLRKKYAAVEGDWKYIYAPTTFVARAPRWIPTLEGWKLIEFGQHLKRLPHIDVDFLLGTYSNARTSNGSHIGSRNISHSTHWGTGIKYASLPQDAFRELFLAYEHYHLDGFDVFGDDAINDLMVMEQARLTARGLSKLGQGSHPISEKDFVEWIDSTFRKSRAWVGALLRYREAELDRLALNSDLPQTNTWWGCSYYNWRIFPQFYVKRTPKAVMPWRGLKSIRNQLKSQTIADVVQGELGERLASVYSLMRHADLWEQKFGTMELTPTTKSLLEGRYNHQFKASPCIWGAEWVWTP